MRSDIEQTILHYYPNRILRSPLDDGSITWTWDTDHAELKALLRDLEAIDPEMANGTRCAYDISEELVLQKQIRLQLSYLGPYAAIDHARNADDDDEDRREVKRRIERALEAHGIELLAEHELDEAAPWIQHGLEDRRPATVWQCLFLLPD